MISKISATTESPAAASYALLAQKKTFFAAPFFNFNTTRPRPAAKLQNKKAEAKKPSPKLLILTSIIATF